MQVRQTYIGVNYGPHACRNTAAMSWLTEVGPCSRIISQSVVVISRIGGTLVRTSALTLIALLLSYGPVVAQSDAALEWVAEGWGRGECNLLTHVALNPETGRWQSVEDSPWGTWTIRRVGPRSVEYTMSSGATRLVELAEGIYVDRALEAADEPPSESDEWTIVEHGIHGPENWRLFLLPPPYPGGPEGVRHYSEVIMAGDVYIWTNWIEEKGVRRRTMYSACKLTER